MEDENDTGAHIEEKSVVLRQPIELQNIQPPRAHIQQRLRAMQRKLSEIAEIPVLIQSTLEAVSKTFGQFLTNDDHDLNVDSGSEDNFSEDDVSEIHSFSSYDHNDDDDEIYEERIKEDSPESDYITEDDEFSCDEEIPDLEIEEAQREPTPEPTEEDLLKQEKKEKILKVERSWPWGDREKIVYKISNCHLVPSVSLVQNRIKQLSESKIMSYYENKCKETV